MKLEKLFDHIDQSGGPDACWPWLKGKHTMGYGSVHIGPRATLAHIVALEISTGEPANGRSSLHTCDNPPCCNPAHLFWGTQKDNIKDMDAKGRRVTVASKGEKSPHARLTNDQATEIRAVYIPYHREFGTSALGKKYGVSQKCISQIVLNKTYIEA